MSHLKNIANKTKSQNDFIQYKKQRNYVVKLNKQEKKIFFHNVDPKLHEIHISGQRDFFWCKIMKLSLMILI